VVPRWGGDTNFMPVVGETRVLPELVAESYRKLATLLRMNGMIALADGGSIHFEDVGEGPAVVLLHPGLWDMRTWEPQIQPLVDAGFRVLRFDQRGYGTVRRCPRRSTRASMTPSRCSTSAGSRRRAFVGCSMGGAVAITDGDRAPGVRGRWSRGVGLPGLPVGRGARGHAVRADRGGDGTGDLVLATDESDEGVGCDRHRGCDRRRIREIALDNTQNFTIDEELDVWSKYPTYDHLEEIDVPTLVSRETRMCAASRRSPTSSRRGSPARGSS
jgi:pimeloyl-ACP methyl ester carboxylesterase